MSKKTKNLTDPEEIKSIVEKGDISNIQHKPYL